MKNKWMQLKHGRGWKKRSFTIEPIQGDWCLKCGGYFVASFPTAGSCQRVGDCIFREFNRVDETLHYEHNKTKETDNGI